MIRQLNARAKELSRHLSIDGYLYWQADQLHLGIAMFESAMTSTSALTIPPAPLEWGMEISSTAVDSIGIFETDMYLSDIHQGDGAGKTSSFKQCIFLSDIDKAHVFSRLVKAI